MDRRNAATLQVLFLFLGVTVPLNWWRHIAVGMLAPQFRPFIAADIVAALLCFVCWWMIRRGALRGAIALFVTAQLGAASVGYATTGVLIDQTAQMLTLVIAGLILGRRALWTVFLMLLGVVLIGVGVALVPNVRAEQALTRAAVLLPSFFMSYLVITLVLDRSIAALREALTESKARGARLENEMRERERAQAQLIEAQKLEATGRLASGVAHDFDNILALMAAFSGERHRVDPGADAHARAEALAQALEGVEQAAQRGMALTRKLLTFARPQPAALETIDVGRALAELAPMLRQTFGPDVRVHVPRGEAALPIRIDRHHFDLALLNLASNARDAMPDGGTFAIDAGESDDGAIEIVLRDDGHGMGEAVRRRIFEPFFSTKATCSGTGLGLAVVHSLVTSAGGTIDVDSAPGAGTTFRIRLPRAPEAPAAQRSEVST
ncbi:ATP-binding protein [Luteimonas sp. FCS-9]|uniref:sensor histidine kinase n=1 Tax=Luteimonas sp. FCS-9 TaxID=1547516 RepID=UPI001E31C7C1|nr:ATP-binding protein [Luteimonas sp. FCS-9]